MEWLATAWKWLSENGDALWGLWASLLAAATVIVAWTPTKKDDSFLSTLGSAAQAIRNLLVARRLEDSRDQDPEAAVVRTAKKE